MKNTALRAATALCIVATLLLTACRSKQDTTGTTAGVVTQVDSHKAQAQRVQTKMTMALRTDDHHFTVGGTLRMERGKIIQLSIMPFGLVEAGVIEFTPDGVLFLYRTGHQYVRARYKDIPLLRDNNIDFNAVQSLFWGELFAPGKRSCSVDDFNAQTIGQSIVLSTKNNRDIMVKFVTSLTGGILRQTQVTGAQATYTGAVLNWKYTDYMRVGRGELPSQFEMSIENTDRPVSCRFTLSKLKIDPEWKGSIVTQVDKRYNEVQLNNILTRLLNFSF